MPPESIPGSSSSSSSGGGPGGKANTTTTTTTWGKFKKSGDSASNSGSNTPRKGSRSNAGSDAEDGSAPVVATTSSTPTTTTVVPMSSIMGKGSRGYVLWDIIENVPIPSGVSVADFRKAIEQQLINMGILKAGLLHDIRCKAWHDRPPPAKRVCALCAARDGAARGQV